MGSTDSLVWRASKDGGTTMSKSRTADEGR